MTDCDECDDCDDCDELDDITWCPWCGEPDTDGEFCNTSCMVRHHRDRQGRDRQARIPRLSVGNYLRVTAGES